MRSAQAKAQLRVLRSRDPDKARSCAVGHNTFEQARVCLSQVLEEMGRAMTATDVRRGMIIAGATAAVALALLFARPLYSVATEPNGASSADVSQPVADQEPTTETVGFFPSPTIETNPQLFVGCGDNSNGYYADPPEPTLALVRYERMP